MYKTILLHLGDLKNLESMIPAAIDLARRSDGHLIGLAVVPPFIFHPAYLPGAHEIIVDEHRKAFTERLKGARTMFEAAARDAGLSAEWIDDDASLSPVWHKVCEYANAVDLVVCTKPVPDTAAAGTGEELPLRTGRPVLFLPEGNHVGFGRRIIVAWNGKREAGRAAFDALPLLKGAEWVRVLWIDPGNSGGHPQDLPSADLCTSLARHNVTCIAAEGNAQDMEAGAGILAAADGSRADLVVMGCYGHSRLREVVLGGATRHVLQNMRIPVLMAH